MASSAVIVLADGFEEIEAITVIDVLRRADFDVRVLGLDGTEIRGAHGLAVKADSTLNEYDGKQDIVVLPGGLPGAQNLADSRLVGKMLENQIADGGWVGAICAAPALVLAPAGILDGKKATCYPGFEDRFTTGIQFTTDSVAVDGRIITSRGPGTALEFSLTIVENLVSFEKASELRQGMLAPTAV